VSEIVRGLFWIGFGSTAGLTLFVVMGEHSEKILIVWLALGITTLLVGCLGSSIAKKKSVPLGERRGAGNWDDLLP